ncbi:isoleucyl-tRNA synthetase [Pedobacter sp. ASV28]|uniref:isoleucyl-tRNA synthetase n=1 Tax=Pedobacter sp. ASV28 TaxID=2795123 RepID=UPI0018EDC1BD|nr:isoleucyl-tRNA synthetase [Pedobacter sp. ASV28]
MIKDLKLKKAIIVIVLGIVALIVAKIMEEYRLAGHNIVLAISGVLLIVGALISIYPILFAKKVDKDGKKVELQPVAKEAITEETAS